MAGFFHSNETGKKLHDAGGSPEMFNGRRDMADQKMIILYSSSLPLMEDIF